MTINKSQGQSLQYVGIDIRTQECFTHGQLYVALSRATNRANMHIITPDVAAFDLPRMITNVQWKEVLLPSSNAISTISRPSLSVTASSIISSPILKVPFKAFFSTTGKTFPALPSSITPLANFPVISSSAEDQLIYEKLEGKTICQALENNFQDVQKIISVQD